MITVVLRWDRSRTDRLVRTFVRLHRPADRSRRTQRRHLQQQQLYRRFHRPYRQRLSNPLRDSPLIPRRRRSRRWSNVKANLHPSFSSINPLTSTSKVSRSVSTSTILSPMHHHRRSPLTTKSTTPKPTRSRPPRPRCPHNRMTIRSLRAVRSNATIAARPSTPVQIFVLNSMGTTRRRPRLPMSIHFYSFSTISNGLHRTILSNWPT